MTNFDNLEISDMQEKLNLSIARLNIPEEYLRTYLLDRNEVFRCNRDQLLAKIEEMYTIIECHQSIISLLRGYGRLGAKLSLEEGKVTGVKIQKTILAKKGGIGKKAKYQPLKDLAKKLVSAKNFSSRRNAAKTITPEVLAESQKLGIALSLDQAEITITSWLKEMGLPANI